MVLGPNIATRYGAVKEGLPIDGWRVLDCFGKSIPLHRFVMSARLLASMKTSSRRKIRVKPDGSARNRRESAKELYRRLVLPSLKDSEVEVIRRNTQALARILCEHVWGKRFY